jgi:hypothetical protein
MKGKIAHVLNVLMIVLIKRLLPISFFLGPRVSAQEDLAIQSRAAALHRSAGGETASRRQTGPEGAEIKSTLNGVLSN